MNASLFINGAGVLSTAGRGLDALRARVAGGWVPPAMAKLPGGTEIPVYPLPPSSLDDKSLGRKVRRADRLSKMATFAAADALAAANLPADTPRDRIGLVVASALGTHTTTFQFLDEILTFGDAAVSPTVFSHSVQGAPAAYISATLGIRGPAVTFTQVHFSFHHALTLAQCWLASGRCDYMLVGTADELGSVMLHISGTVLDFADDGKIQPFRFRKRSRAVPGEGSAFFLLSREAAPGCLAQITGVSIEETWPGGESELDLLEADGILPDESPYASTVTGNNPVAAYSPILGSMCAGTGLHAAIAALLLSDATLTTTSVPPGAIRLTRMDCNGRAGIIHFQKP